MEKPKVLSGLALAAIAAGGLAARLWLAWQKITDLLIRFVPDDSFFVFRIARNLAAGQGLTFDGVVPANSPRLLWEALLALVFVAIPANDDLAAHVILTIGAVADTVTVVLLFLIMTKLFQDRVAALFTAALYAFMPYAIRQAINGLETALAIMLLAAAFLIFIGLKADEPRDRRRYYFLGIFTGIIILTRLDYALFPILAFLVLVLRPASRRAGSLLLAGTATLALPWIAFSLIGYHELLPSSGYAATYTYYNNYLVNHTPTVAGFLGESWYYFYKAFRYYAFPFFAIHRAFAGPVAFVVLVLASVVTYVRADRDGRARFRLVLLPMAMVAILLTFHGFVLWYAREWHTGPSLLATALVVGAIVALFGEKQGRRARGVLVVGLAVILVPAYMLIARRDWAAEAYKPFINHYRVSLWARDNLPADAVIGSFDGGVPGYYTHRRVVDLVGVENEQAFAALRERRLGAYLDEAGIDYLHLMPCRTDPYYGWFWGEDITKRLDGPLYSSTEPGVQEEMRTATLYRVIHRSPPRK